jgi:hypothetical protein
MAIRFYIVPLEVVAGVLTRRGPKYFSWPFDPDAPALIPADVRWEMRDFGLQPTGLVAADVTPAQNTALSAQADVITVPANLDNNVGAANLATVRSKLESIGIPGDAIVASTDYRHIVRGIIAIFAVAQRLDGLQGGAIFTDNRTLATTLGELSAGARQQLQDAATELGYDYSSLTLASTLRDVLKTLANQQSADSMLGVTI